MHVQIVFDEKETVRDIRNNATKEVLKSDEYQSKPVVYLKPGEYTFRDGPTGQEFVSTIKAMDACEARWTKRCVLGDYVTRYDLYTDTLAIRHIPDDASNTYFTADCPPNFEYRPVLEDGELIILVDYDYLTDQSWPQVVKNTRCIMELIVVRLYCVGGKHNDQIKEKRTSEKHEDKGGSYGRSEGC